MLELIMSDVVIPAPIALFMILCTMLFVVTVAVGVYFGSKIEKIERVEGGKDE